MNKKSFVLYLDHQELFNKLPDEVAGKLIKHIFNYVNGDDSKIDDLLLDIAFSPIKQTLKRDAEKWANQLKQRSEAGKKSAEVRASKSNESNERSTKSTSVESRSTKSTDSVSVSVSVSDSVNDKDLKESQHEQSSRSRRNPSVPYQEILNRYKSHLNGNEDYNLVEVMVLTEKRKAKVKKLWSLVKQDLNRIDKYFCWLYQARENHKWMFGYNSRNWVADLEYICREETFTKAQEGRLGDWEQAA